jgi:hypothetical protein
MCCAACRHSISELYASGVIYLHAIKKDGVHAHATKKFSDTCMP